MTPEELSRFVDRQEEINRKAKESLKKAIHSLNLKMIFSDRSTARTAFISAILRRTDKYFNASLENGRELKEKKLAS